MPLEVFANAPAQDPTLVLALSSATATTAAVSTPAGLPPADPTTAVPSQWRGSFLDPSGNVLERFVCTDSRTATLTVVRQAEDALALPAGVWPVGTRVAHDLTAGAMNSIVGPVRWRRHASAAQAIPTGNFALTLDALDYDTAGMEGAAGGVATVRRAGLYRVSVGGLFLGATQSAQMWVAKNGVANAPRYAWTNGTLATLNASEEVPLAVGDTLTAYVALTTAVSSSVTYSNPFMSVTRVSD